MSYAKFEFGQVVITPRAYKEIDHREAFNALMSHGRGEYGVVSENDWQANDEAVRTGGRIFSAYMSSKDVRFWIITEADRSVTTILLPDEY